MGLLNLFKRLFSIEQTESDEEYPALPAELEIIHNETSASVCRECGEERPEQSFKHGWTKMKTCKHCRVIHQNLERVYKRGDLYDRNGDPKKLKKCYFYEVAKSRSVILLIDGKTEAYTSRIIMMKRLREYYG